MLRIKTMQLCDQPQVNTMHVIRLLEDLKNELVDGVEYNRIAGLDTDKLTTRQQNALYNWLHNTVENRLDRIAENN